ncbi:MAG: hypothetical protein A2X78_03945 [Gammaproteobacteria bacterium GWE2_37_16]|nr:MAG: hypothetical protein A2X78_03945 [Gammaproteobacteria bacterium GWE2_37_16]
MSKIEFHLLPEITIEACLRSICQLVEQNYLNNKSVFLHTDSESLAKQLDDLLWIFKDVSFLPHEIYKENSVSQAPILIGINLTAAPKMDILINLTTEMTKFHKQFTQILEIVPNDETLKANARQRYKYYKEHGEELLINHL